jgi:hypothetical protein
MGFFEELRAGIGSIGNKGEGKTPELDDILTWVSDLNEIDNEPFDGPLEIIPGSRNKVFEIYGRAPKDKNPAHVAKWPKAKMTTAKNLPGSWNSGKGKLFMLAYMEDYLREALRRCDSLDVLNSIERMGCYSHRHIRHNTANPLSYHSWGAAVDINPKDNKAISKKKQQVAPPFSKQYLKVWPNHLQLKVVRAFQSVGFAWGGDWGKTDWYEWVKKHGIGWDADNIQWPDDWRRVTFFDPMHFELIRR